MSLKVSWSIRDHSLIRLDPILDYFVGLISVGIGVFLWLFCSQYPESVFIISFTFYKFNIGHCVLPSGLVANCMITGSNRVYHVVNTAAQPSWGHVYSFSIDTPRRYHTSFEHNTWYTLHIYPKLSCYGHTGSSYQILSFFTGFIGSFSKPTIQNFVHHITAKSTTSPSLSIVVHHVMYNAVYRTKSSW